MQQAKNNHQEETQETEISNIRTYSKNDFQASVSQRSQEENIELINVINVMEQTMITLSSFGKRLKTQLVLNLIQQDK